jgi:catalase (peroxidase I)
MNATLQTVAEDELQAITSQLTTLAQYCAPKLLRLAIYDASSWDTFSQTGGANASILQPEELSYPSNAGLQDVANALQELKALFAPTMSTADIIALSGVIAAVILSGHHPDAGPNIQFRPGRRVSTITMPESRIPTFKNIYQISTSTYSNQQQQPDALIKAFYRMGLSTRQAVALLGAHPFGRWWSKPQVFEDLWPSLEQFQGGTNSNGTNGTFQDESSSSPQGDSPRKSKSVTIFDPTFYKDVLEGKDPMSRVLASNPECRAVMKEFINHPSHWYAVYAMAYQQLTEAPTGMPLPTVSWGEWMRAVVTGRMVIGQGNKGGGSSCGMVSNGAVVVGTGVVMVALGGWWLWNSSSSSNRRKRL